MIMKQGSNCEACAPTVNSSASISIMVGALRDAMGVKALERALHCDKRVIAGYIDKGIEPRWQRGVLIYNLVATELCNV